MRCPVLSQDHHCILPCYSRSESCLQAKEAYKQAVAQYETKQEALQGLIERREAAHQALLVPSPVPAEPGGSDAGAVLQFMCQQ